jgi:sterol desaturase/sphingolipid hydroxylase (fatty acid hydroxylase superfamily)
VTCLRSRLLSLPTNASDAAGTTLWEPVEPGYHASGRSVDEIWQPTQRLLAQAVAFWLSPDIRGSFIALAAFFAGVVLIEPRFGRDPRRYLSTHFRTDAVYMIFTVGGLYTLLVWRPVFLVLDASVRHYAPFLPLRLLDDLPGMAQFVLFLVAVDLVRYWKHRWMHASRVLWAFHSVHHTQQELTFLTSYRFHILDMLLDSAISFVISQFLGIPPTLWVPATVVLIWYQSLQHSDLDWSYGKLDRVLVSPRFHSVHHSTDPRHYGKNFGLLLSLWDTLFGTADAHPRRPTAYGVPGLNSRESFLAQLVFPFRMLTTTHSRQSGVDRRDPGVPAA